LIRRSDEQKEDVTTLTAKSEKRRSGCVLTWVMIATAFVVSVYIKKRRKCEQTTDISNLK